MQIYTVQAGESLSIIARDVLGNLERWKELALLNAIDYPYIIRPGQILELPDDSQPVQEVKRKGAVPAGAATTSQQTAAGVPPATLAVLAVVVAAVFFLGRK